MANIIAAIITGLCSIIVAIIAHQQKKIMRQQKELADKTEQRAQKRAQEEILSMKMQFASMKLGQASIGLSDKVAEALQTGNFDGPVTHAREEAVAVEEECKTIMDEYQEFLIIVTAQQTTKV